MPLRKGRLAGPLLCILLGGLAVGAIAGPRPAGPIPTASDLYTRMLSANARYSYRGREAITYWNSGRTEAVIVSHLAPRLRRLDFLSPVRREGAIFLSNGHEEWQYDPHTREVDHFRLTPNAVINPVASYLLLKAHYQVAVEPSAQTIDNRKAYILTITSAKTGRIARKRWIDAATGVVLKDEQYEGVKEDGHERARLAVTQAFTGIDFHPRLTAQMFDPTLLTRRSVHVKYDPAVAETPVPIREMQRDLAHAWLTPSTLAGFHLVSAAIMSGPRPRLHLRYSDGLNLVSLFEQRRQQTRVPTVVPRAKPLRIGALHTQVVVKSAFTIINWDTPTFILSIVGEVPVPMRTLEQLVLAVDDRRP